MNDLSPEAKAIIEAGLGSDEPTGADRDRVRRAIAMRVGVGLAAGTAVGTAATKATATLGSSGAATAGGAASTTVVGSVGVTSATAAGAGASGAGTVVAGAAGAGAKTLFTSVVAKVALGVALAGGGGAALYEARTSSTPATDGHSHAAATTDDPTQLPAPVAPRRAAPSGPTASPADPVADPEPTLVPMRVEAPSVPANPAPASPVRAPVVAAKVAHEQAAPAAREPAPSTLSQESRLLQEANDAMLRKEPDVALDRLAEHERSYPNGLLTEERVGQRVLALCAAGRESEAKGLAITFFSRYPRSPYVSRVETSCAGSATKP